MEGKPREILMYQVRISNHNIRFRFRFTHISVGRLQTEDFVADRAALRFPGRIRQRDLILVVALSDRNLTRHVTRQQQVTAADIHHRTTTVGLAVDVGDIHRNLVAVKRRVSPQSHILLRGEGDAEVAVVIGFQRTMCHGARFVGGAPPIAAPPRERGVAGHAVAHRGMVKGIAR